MQTSMMATSEIFLIAMLIIFTIPYLVWRIGKTDYYAPLVVVQIIAGILLGPGVLGAAFPEYYHFIFKADPNVMPTLNGIAQWAVMVFVMIAGVELDLKKAWQHRSEGALMAGLALGLPLVFGSIAEIGLLLLPGWIGPQARTWQFVVGVGMACAVTALPILILLMEKLEMLRQPLGQRILRYASLDDIAIWGVLATILMDWTRVGRQCAFLLSFAIATYLFRKLMAWLQERDRWYVSLIWLAACGFAGLVGAALYGWCVSRGRCHGWGLVRAGENGLNASPCSVGDDAGIFLEYWLTNDVGCRRSDRILGSGSVIACFSIR